MLRGEVSIEGLTMVSSTGLERRSLRSLGSRHSELKQERAIHLW